MVEFMVCGRPKPKGSWKAFDLNARRRASWWSIMKRAQWSRSGISIRSLIADARKGEFMRSQVRLAPDNERSKAWQQKVAECARDAMGEQKPYEGAVRIDIKYVFARPKGHWRGNGALSAKGLRSPHPITRTTGDRDKLDRCIKDAMSGIVYVDDSQDVCGGSRKEYAISQHDPEYAVVVVQEVDGGGE